MSERFVASPWRFGIAVVALLILPALMAVAMVIYAAAAFCLLHGFFGAGDGQVVLYGFMFLLFALMLTQLCLWVRRGRKLMVRYQRGALGLFVMCAVTPAVGWYLSGIWPAFPNAYWSVTLVYGLYGLWLAVDAWEDRWST